MMETQELCLDRISSLPQPIIETILCLVPFRDAVSTSILSKKWRYNWFKIPKLALESEDMFVWVTSPKPVFDWEDFSDVMPRTHNYKCKVYNGINNVLSLHEGPIHDFTLILHIDNISVEIDQIITHLSRKFYTLKKLKLDLGDHSNLYELPISIFSLHRLTDLYLHVCDLDFKPPFSGFGCLTSLHLEDVRVTTETLLHLISKSPLLKSFTQIITEFHIYENRYLFNRDKYTLTDLFECLPAIEYFCVSMLVIEVIFCLGVVPRELPPSLVYVKHLILDEVFFPQNIPFVLLMLKCSPNLEKLKLQMYEEQRTWQSETVNVSYSDISLEHLKELEIEDFTNMMSELDFVKFMLTKSPVLKKLSIFLHHEVDLHEEVNMLRILLRSPRASPMVEIIVEHPPKNILYIFTIYYWKKIISEMKPQRLSTTSDTTSDIISSLLPIQAAARTSILSKEWRYSWTKIPKLTFNAITFLVSTHNIVELKNDMESERKRMRKRCKLLYAMYQVLLMRQAPILEFSLTIDMDSTCVEIDQLLIYLSRNATVKKFILDTTKPFRFEFRRYKVPLSLFSLHQLTHLHLSACDLDHQPTFNGFGSLTSLLLRRVHISIKTLLHLLSKCPLLEDFSLFILHGDILGNTNSTITELFKCLPLIERLHIWHWIIMIFAQGGVPKVLPTSLLHLKCLFIEDFHFSDEYGLPFVALVIRNSPNLEELKLRIYPHIPSSKWKSIESITMADYSDFWLEHLNEFEIKDFSNLKHEMDFVKLILAKSPVLKKLSIIVYHGKVDADNKMLILENLLCSPRASPFVKIIVASWKMKSRV